ncbi:MAG: lipoprotein [Polaribacter sp.]|nr:lipoprotein [Polaribacter sp.]
MKKIVLILLILFMVSSCSSGEKEIYILPKDYTGYIILIFNQENGAEKKYEEDKRVYDIPSSGILKTQFKPNFGWSEFSEFYYENSNSKKIPYTYEFKELNADSIVVYGGTTGTANRDLEGTSVVKFSKYYIGNKAQIQDAIDKADSFDYIKIADSTE